MSYTVQQLADIAGISVRTLHYYDEVGILKPTQVKRNGYRFYEEAELLKLQQIMFWKELDFPLLEIKRIMSESGFNMTKALEAQRDMIEQRKKRLGNLTKTIDKTIKKINKQIIMEDKEIFESFKAHEKKYAAEVKERWGNTEAYKQSKERMAKMSKDDIVKMKKDADRWMKNFIEHMKYGPESDIVQKLIADHYNALRTFYEPNLELYRGLADMYVTDPRFEAYYEKYSPGLALFMQKAMFKYCDDNA